MKNKILFTLIIILLLIPLSQAKIIHSSEITSRPWWLNLFSVTGAGDVAYKVKYPYTAIVDNGPCMGDPTTKVQFLFNGVPHVAQYTVDDVCGRLVGYDNIYCKKVEFTITHEGSVEICARYKCSASNWEWYNDPVCKEVYISNDAWCKWGDIKIDPGQEVCDDDGVHVHVCDYADGVTTLTTVSCASGKSCTPNEVKASGSSCRSTCAYNVNTCPAWSDCYHFEQYCLASGCGNLKRSCVSWGDYDYSNNDENGEEQTEEEEEQTEETEQTNSFWQNIGDIINWLSQPARSQDGEQTEQGSEEGEGNNEGDGESNVNEGNCLGEGEHFYKNVYYTRSGAFGTKYKVRPNTLRARTVFQNKVFDENPCCEDLIPLFVEKGEIKNSALFAYEHYTYDEYKCVSKDSPEVAGFCIPQIHKLLTPYTHSTSCQTDTILFIAGVIILVLLVRELK